MEAVGRWKYDGAGYFECKGGGHTGDYGIGCADGIGCTSNRKSDNINYSLYPRDKALFDGKLGTGHICQELPNLWKKEYPCDKAQLFFKCVTDAKRKFARLGQNMKPTKGGVKSPI